MENFQTDEEAENRAILAHWQDEALEAYPDHALRAQKIITQMLQEHDPEKWKIYTFQKEPELTTFHTLGFALYLIAQMLCRYEEMGREIDQMFVRMCKAHLHLLPPDDNIPPWVNPHDQ